MEGNKSLEETFTPLPPPPPMQKERAIICRRKPRREAPAPANKSEVAILSKYDS
jgi:hypothetical protein